jgi:organic hydroperoxide reductase OsmC/OhrA
MDTVKIYNPIPAEPKKAIVRHPARLQRLLPEKGGCPMSEEYHDSSRTAVYNTTVSWKGEHWGHIVMGNGPEMDFSAPPDAHGHAGVLTPEDAFVASANTCIMMMFIWAAERFKLDLVSYECRAEGTS